MINIYNKIKGEKPVKSLARITGIIIMIAVWILIDKGNIYGQSISDGDVISKSTQEPVSRSALFRSADDATGDDGLGGDVPTVDEDDLITIKPNPVEGELVFDFEFTVKTGIPYEVLDPLGRFAFQGVFEPGITTQSLDFAMLKTGMYIVRMHLGNKLEVRRIIKQ